MKLFKRKHSDKSKQKSPRKISGWANLITAILTFFLAIAVLLDPIVNILGESYDKFDLSLPLLLILTSLLVVYVLEQSRHITFLNEEIFRITNKLQSEVSSAAQSLNTLTNKDTSKLLSGEALSREYFLFDGFNDREYFAVNAPLQFELHNGTRRQIDIHLDRYKSPYFFKAHYSYPILNSLTIKERRVWLEGILNFLKQLSQEELTLEERTKILFYVPKNSNQEFKTQKFSYFLGTKIGIKQCITYIHSDPYFNQDLRKPNSVLINYSDVVINSIQDIVVNENLQMTCIAGIDNFIEYCEDLLLREASNQEA